MNGKSLVEYMRIIADAINNNKIPRITSIWDRLIDSRMKQIQR